MKTDAAGFAVVNAQSGEEIKLAMDRHLMNGRYASDSLYGAGGAGERIAQLLAQLPLRIDKRLTY